MDLYVKLIQNGIKTIDDVPKKFKKAVAEKLKAIQDNEGAE